MSALRLPTLLLVLGLVPSLVRANDPPPVRESLLVPSRRANLLELRAGAGFGGVSQLYGVEHRMRVGEAAVTYHGRSIWYVRGSLWPTAILVGSPIRLAAGSLVAGVDHPLVGLGLGFGFARLTFDPPGAWSDPGYEQRSVAELTHLLVLEARVGAHDGFHFGLRLSAARHHGRFRKGEYTMFLHVPITRWLSAQITATHGSLAMGSIHGGGGVRARLYGDGGRGSTFVWLRSEFYGVYRKGDDGESVMLGGNFMFGTELRL